MLVRRRSQKLGEVPLDVPPRDAAMRRDLVDADGAACVLLNESHRLRDQRVFDRHGIGRAAGDDALRGDHDRFARRLLALHEMLQQRSRLVADELDVEFDAGERRVAQIA
jgi:hypothetical protein